MSSMLWLWIEVLIKAWISDQPLSNLSHHSRNMMNAEDDAHLGRGKASDPSRLTAEDNDATVWRTEVDRDEDSEEVRWKWGFL